MADAHSPSDVERHYPGRNGQTTVKAWRPLFELLSPAGRRARLAVLIFHRVHERPDSLFPGDMHAAVFRERMLWIREWFNVLPLEEAVGALARGTLPARALSITFDDGYADNATVAIPILRELALPATVFVSTGFLDGGCMWNDTVIEAFRRARGPELDLSGVGLGRHRVDSPDTRRFAISAVIRTIKHLPPTSRNEKVEAIRATVGVALPGDLMMTRAALRKLAGEGTGVGAHTIHHPILASLSEAEAATEIGDGRAALEEIVRQPVGLFAYPNGRPFADYEGVHVRMVRHAGFVAAFSTSGGVAGLHDPPFELPRFTPWDRTASRWALRLGRNYFSRVTRAVN